MFQNECEISIEIEKKFTFYNDYLYKKQRQKSESIQFSLFKNHNDKLYF